MRVGCKADLLLDHFDGKQSRESVDLPRLSLDLDPFGGTDPLGMLPLLLKENC